MDSQPILDATILATLGATGGYSNIVSMSQSTNVLLLSVVDVIRQRFYWETNFNPISDALYDAILNGLDDVVRELMANISVGSFFWSVAFLTDPNLLVPIGQTVLQSDYVELTAVVPATWLVGADIQLPNMVGAGFITGMIVPDVGQLTGSNTHQLSVAEMPSHNHSQNPHAHTEISPLTTPTGAGPVVAGASLVVPTPIATGLTSASNNPTGGDNAHNNVQLSLQVIPYLIAR